MRLIWLASMMTIALLGQEHEHQEGGGGRGGMRPPMSPLMMALDGDHDGAVSAKELQQASAALRKADKNGDGKLDGEELRPAFRGRGPEGGEGRREGRPGGGGANPGNMVDTLMGFDADKNGKLTKAEVPERMQGLFDRADVNKDDVLTRDELTKVSAAPRGEGGPGGRQGGPGGPEGGPRGRMMDPIAAALDANHDGAVDKSEMQAAPAALKQLDRNSNGSLEAQELRPMMGRGGRRE